MLHPVGAVRMVWNAMCLLWICYDLFVVPLSAFDLEDVVALQVIEWMLTIWWTLDMYVTFRTGIIVGSRVEMSPRKVAENYACTWLACDLTIVIVEWFSRIFSAFASATVIKTQKILRFIRILKLMRVVKLSSFSKQMQEQITSNIVILSLYLALLTFILVLTLHVVACIWYALAKTRDDGWTSVDEYEGDKTEIFWYFASIRWTIAQFNGRTDVDERRNMLERLFTCLCGVVLCALGQAILFSLITKILFDLSEVLSEKTRRKRLMNEYLEQNPCPPLLTLQVKRWVNEYQDVDKDIKKEEQALAILPQLLQIEVLESVRSPILMQHPFFHALPFESQFVMRMICVDVAYAISGIKDDMVFDKGQPCESIIFMDKLTATYGTPADQNATFAKAVSVAMREKTTRSTSYSYSGRTLLARSEGLKIVPAGGWIAEAALWVEWRNQGRLISNAHGILLAVSASKFAKGLKKHHPDAYLLAYLHGQHVAMELRKLHPSELSDILPFEVQLYSPLCVMVTVVAAHDLRNADSMFAGKSDPYCVCRVTGIAGKGGEMCFQTATMNNDLHPIWNHSAEVHMTRHQLLEFTIYDSDYGKADEELGVASLFPEDFANTGFDGSIDLQTSGGFPTSGSIRVRIQVMNDAPDLHQNRTMFMKRSGRASRQG